MDITRRWTLQFVGDPDRPWEVINDREARFLMPLIGECVHVVDEKMCRQDERRRLANRLRQLAGGAPSYAAAAEFIESHADDPHGET